MHPLLSQEDNQMNEQVLLPDEVAARAEIGCIFSTISELATRCMHLPKEHAGMRLWFARCVTAR